MGARVILIFIISVIGTVNGLVLGFIPPALFSGSDGKLLPGLRAGPHPSSMEHARWPFSVGFLLCLFLAAHYFTHTFDLLPNLDRFGRSPLPSPSALIVLYAQVFRLQLAGGLSDAGGESLFPSSCIRLPIVLWAVCKMPCSLLYAGSPSDPFAFSTIKKAPGMYFIKKTACKAVFSLYIPKGKLTPHPGPAWSPATFKPVLRRYSQAAEHRL